MKNSKKIKNYFLLLILAAAFVILPVRQAEAAAVNVITTAKQNSVSKGRWIQNAKGISYKKSDGKYVKNKWVTISGKVYYFSAAGYVKTGWFTYNGDRYYASSKGVVYVSKWKTSGNRKYYLRKSGMRAEKTWVKISGKYYYFGSNGVMTVKSQVTTGGNTYFVGADGVRKSNCWVTSGGKRYYFGKNGIRCQNKWVKYKNKYYYLKNDGTMAVNCWIGNTYYVGSDGARKTSCYVDGYYLDANGKRTEIISFSGKYLMVGDSRIVGMDAAISDPDTKFIGKVSMGYSWLSSTAGPEVKKYLQGKADLTVVFAFGINDLGNISQYISYYQSLVKAYPSAKFYFISVNPVDEKVAAAYGYSVKNSAIKAFNKKLKAAFSSRYFSTYNYLLKNGYNTADGIHYTSATYQKLYQYILSEIS
ncbi:MAG: hypothetical protein PHR92_02735 [Lachnospiraceae bacterium]|nr:hypothetical protein [Lachnospiraceae bacterium]